MKLRDKGTENERNEMEILQQLMDKYNLKILSSTKAEELSARDLAFKFDIPLATCYRKINELEKSGLLRCTAKLLTRDGKRYKVYKSQIISVDISYDNQSLSMELFLEWETPKHVVIDLESGEVKESEVPV